MDGFDFFKAVTKTIDIAKTFLGGGKEEDYFSRDYHDIDTGDKGGGFLDTALGLAKKGAQVYVGMQDSDQKPMFVTPDVPTFKAVSRYRQQGKVGAGNVGYRPTNRIYQDAVTRRMRQMNFEKNLERMTASMTVRPTTRRKAPVSPGKTTITRTTKAKVIT